MEEQVGEELPRKKIRRRKKLLYQNILKQMEFYFSDASLSKDRFLSELLQKDPYIDLSIFLKFNRIRMLTDNMRDLTNALRMSEKLSLSEDNTKIRRITPLQQKQNQDECTIYVERLPAETEHDWLTKIFSKFGNVEYVSIPRYKHNRMIKGFAFIEYDTPEPANKALEYFEFIGCKLPTQMPPERLASIATFEHDKMAKIDELIPEKKKKDKNDEEKTKHEEKNPNDNNTSEVLVDKSAEENKAETVNESADKSNDEATDENVAKAQDQIECVNESTDKSNDEATDETVAKTSDQVESVAEPNLQPNENITKRKQEEDVTDVVIKKAKIDTEIPIITEEQEETAEPQKRKRKRKRNKRKKNTIDLKQIGLKVLSKKEWKQLRNKYLNLQKQKMKSLKDQLYRSRFGNVLHSTESTPRNASKAEKSEETSEPRFQFIPGVIIQFLLSDICTDVKKFKADIKTHTGVEYVDIIPGNCVGYIRFSSNEICSRFLEASFNWAMRILDGEEEKGYWDKILEEREMKLQKESMKKQRGREKLLRKAEQELGKHIRFENVE